MKNNRPKDTPDMMSEEELDEFLETPAKLGDVVKLLVAMTKDVVNLEMRGLQPLITSVAVQIDVIKEILFEAELVSKEEYLEKVQEIIDMANEKFKEKLESTGKGDAAPGVRYEIETSPELDMEIINDKPEEEETKEVEVEEEEE